MFFHKTQLKNLTEFGYNYFDILSGSLRETHETKI